jgi:hypothetical protein
MEQIAEFDPEVAHVQQQDHRLDLGVVVRILDGEHAQALRLTARTPDVVSLTR